MLTESQYSLISTTTFLYPTHPGPLIITYGKTTHINSNMRITHTKEVRLFRGVTGMEQALVQQIFGTVEEAYLADICNRTMNYIINTVTGVLTHLQDNYVQLMPHKLLEREEIVKETIYIPRDPITTVFSAVKELLEFADITGTSYTHLQAVNITYVILHRTGKFELSICKWNCMPAIQKTWVPFKQFFWTSHRELIETSDLTIEDTGMHNDNTVRNVVAGLQEPLQQYQD